MKKIETVIIFLLIAMISSCQQKSKQKPDNTLENQSEVLMESAYTNDVESIEVEGCEYIIIKNAPKEKSRIGFGFMAHKGNCKNPIHYHNRNSLLDSINSNLLTPIDE